MNKYNGLSAIGCILVLFVVLNACSQPVEKEEQNTARIIISGLTEDDASNARIFSVNIFSMVDSTLAKIEQGSDTLGLLIDKPTLAIITIGENRQTLYLENDYDLNISVKKAQGTRRLYFEGKGSQQNNYLAGVAHLRDSILNLEGKNIMQVGLEEFTERISDLEKVLENYFLKNTKRFEFPDEQYDLFNKLNTLTLAAYKENYFFNYPSINNAEVPSSFYIENDIPSDPIYITYNVPEFGMLMMLYMYNRLITPIVSNRSPDSWDTIKHEAVTLIEKKISAQKHPHEIEEFLKAKNVQHWMTNAGLDSSVLKAYDNFNKTYPASDYSRFLAVQYEKLMTLSKGNEAPEIKGLTIKGKWDSLSNYKGKIVYVDVWATWCGPCIKEFPYSQQLNERFEGSSNFIILYVSIDRDTEAWKKMVLDKTDVLKGVHINHKDG
ncbi:MAG: TlpA family protein disulfide reductase, partial [Cyclobacteriaceae bacterium]|nr:TlpA family protein disulfide reductase [Cyclobacteriaceae bacterium]